MASFYRPSNFAASAGGDSLAGTSKAGELAPASVSAKVETQLSNRADITAAHKFFQPAADLGKVVVIPAGDAGASAQAAHAASQQVSPLIQMIMKMPGHIGVLSSFFDALSAFFKPEHWFNFLDPHHLAHQAHASLSHSLSASEHLPINLSLLPHDAPIFSSLGSHVDLSRSLTSTPVEMRLHDLAPGSKDYMNCSGTLDIKKPQFETGAQGFDGKQIEPSVSGPQVSDNVASSTLAGSHRLFTDRIDSIVNVHKPGLSAASNLAANSATSQQASSSLNVSANPYGQSFEALPASAPSSEALVSGPSLSQNVGYHLGAVGPTHLEVPGGFGPSGAVSDTLGGQHVLATDAPFAQPNASAMHTEAQPILSNDATTALPTASNSAAVSHALPASDQSASSAIGLKAKPLGLNAFKDKHAIAYDSLGYNLGGHGASSALSASTPAQANTHAMDQIAHQAKGGHHGGKAIDQIAHRSISHKVGDHVKASVAADTQTVQAKPATALDRSIATRVDGLSSNNTISQPSSDNSVSSAYSVKTGDNLWDIARKQLGAGSRWKEIYNLNSKVLGDNPSLIHAGTQLQLPGQADIAGNSAGMVAASSEAQKYVVQSGDSLWKIAQEHLGGGEKWGQLFHGNQQVIGDNPRLIFPGQELNLGDATQVASAGNAANSTMSAMATPLSNPVAMQPPAAFGHPNMPSSAPSNQHAVEAIADNGPGAVQAATTSTQPAAHSAPSFSIPKSLIPDLSFLKKKH